MYREIVPSGGGWNKEEATRRVDSLFSVLWKEFLVFQDWTCYPVKNSRSHFQHIM